MLICAIAALTVLILMRAFEITLNDKEMWFGFIMVFIMLTTALAIFFHLIFMSVYSGESVTEQWLALEVLNEDADNAYDRYVSKTYAIRSDGAKVVKSFTIKHDGDEIFFDRCQDLTITVTTYTAPTMKITYTTRGGNLSHWIVNKTLTRVAPKRDFEFLLPESH